LALSALRSILVSWTLLLALIAPASSQAVGGPRAERSNPGHSVTTPSREALDRDLHDILARPDFRRAMRGGGQDPRNVGQWLLLHLRRLLDRLGGLQETNYGLFLVAVIVGTVLLAALLAHITYTVARALRTAGKPGAAKAKVIREGPKTPDDLRRQAEGLASRGDYREAVRLLYVALIRGLQLKGVLPRTSAHTNWEHLHQLRARPDLVAVVRPFTETFDAKWYGRRPAEAADVDRCRGWLDAALREVEAQ